MLKDRLSLIPRALIKKKSLLISTGFVVYSPVPVKRYHLRQKNKQTNKKKTESHTLHLAFPRKCQLSATREARLHTRGYKSRLVVGERQGQSNLVFYWLFFIILDPLSI